MKPMHRLALSAFVICSTLSVLGCNSLPVVWDWKSDPYSASREGYIISAEGKTVRMDSVEIEDFTCFPSKNMEELNVNIKRVKKYEKELSEYLK